MPNLDHQLLGVPGVHRAPAVEQYNQPLTLLILPKLRVPIPFLILVSMLGTYDLFLPVLASELEHRPRLSLLSSLMTLSWFLTANILAYTSINTCRTSSPHLWWLTFGILCIMYLMVLEVFLLGFVVFIMAPLLFVSLFFYHLTVRY